MEGLQRWRRRVVLVTGASSGIGAAICKALAWQGVTVVGCARDYPRLEGIMQELDNAPGEMHIYRCDLSSERDIDTMFERIRGKFRRLDACINNAGFTTDSPLMTGSPADWRKIMEVNVLGLCHCSKEALKLMIENNIKDGQIIQIDCITGRRFPEKALAGLNFFYATKSAVQTLAEGLRREVRQSSHPSIRVASITPGAIETEFTARGFGQETADGLYKKLPCLQPEDIIPAVSYILGSPAHVEINDIVLQPVAYTI